MAPSLIFLPVASMLIIMQCLRVGDFGTSSFVCQDKASASATRCGTPLFTAPEAIQVCTDTQSATTSGTVYIAIYIEIEGLT